MNIEEEILKLKQRVAYLESLVNTPMPIEQPTQKAKTTRDTTRYMFEGKVYPKNKLVLAVIKAYANAKKPTLSELQNIFDKSLQGSLNVVEDFLIASQIKDCSKRYFTKPQDQLTLKDSKVAVVCTQWGIFNITKFIKCAENLGYVIEKI